MSLWSSFSFSELSPRWGHVSVGVDGLVYVYGGRTKDFWREKSSLASRVHVFNPCQESWQLDRRPEGTPPPGLIDAACTSIGHHAYIYGGFDGQNEHGVLHQLNTSTLSWRELSKASDHGPMRKRMCGMINFDDQLLLFGGIGKPSNLTQRGAEFVEDPYDGSGWTNELHTFCLNKGEGVYFCNKCNLLVSKILALAICMSKMFVSLSQPPLSYNLSPWNTRR